MKIRCFHLDSGKKESELLEAAGAEPRLINWEVFVPCNKNTVTIKI